MVSSVVKQSEMSKKLNAKQGLRLRMLKFNTGKGRHVTWYGYGTQEMSCSVQGMFSREL